MFEIQLEPDIDLKIKKYWKCYLDFKSVQTLNIPYPKLSVLDAVLKNACVHSFYM